MSIEETNNQYQTLADSFLKESGLFEVLGKYGRVVLGGSYAAHLMMSGDVDLGIVRDRPFEMEEMFAILKDIHSSTRKQFRSYYVKSDWNDPRKGNQYPFGHYIGLRAIINEENWKFDLWFVSEDEDKRIQHSNRLDISRQGLTAAQRETILRFKQYRKEHHLLISGQEIYELVLRQNASDPAIMEPPRSAP